MTTDQGKIAGIALIIGGALMAFGAVRLLDTNLVLTVVLALGGLALLWIGNMLREVAQEVDYERDVRE